MYFMIVNIFHYCCCCTNINLELDFFSIAQLLTCKIFLREKNQNNQDTTQQNLMFLNSLIFLENKKSDYYTN